MENAINIAAPGDSISILTLITQASLLVQLVMLSLLLASIVSWTMIFSKHYRLKSAFKIADRIVVLDKGYILTIGTVEEVRASDNERVQNLLNRTIEVEELDPEAYLKRLIEGR